MQAETFDQLVIPGTEEEQEEQAPASDTTLNPSDSTFSIKGSFHAHDNATSSSDNLEHKNIVNINSVDITKKDGSDSFIAKVSRVAVELAESAISAACERVRKATPFGPGSYHSLQKSHVIYSAPSTLSTLLRPETFLQHLLLSRTSYTSTYMCQLVTEKATNTNISLLFSSFLFFSLLFSSFLFFSLLSSNPSPMHAAVMKLHRMGGCLSSVAGPFEAERWNDSRRERNRNRARPDKRP
jgi:hypothetical protein